MSGPWIFQQKWEFTMQTRSSRSEAKVSMKLCEKQVNHENYLFLLWKNISDTAWNVLEIFKNYLSVVEIVDAVIFIFVGVTTPHWSGQSFRQKMPKLSFTGVFRAVCPNVFRTPKSSNSTS